MRRPICGNGFQCIEMATEPRKSKPGDEPTTPPPPGGHDQWILHALNGLSKQLDDLKSDLHRRIDSVDDKLSELNRRASRVEKFMWCATAGVAVLVLMAGWLWTAFRPIISAIADRILNG